MFVCLIYTFKRDAKVPQAPALAGDIELLEVPEVRSGRQGADFGHRSVAEGLALQSVHVLVLLVERAGFVTEDARFGPAQR